MLSREIDLARATGVEPSLHRVFPLKRRRAISFRVPEMPVRAHALIGKKATGNQHNSESRRRRTEPSHGVPASLAVAWMVRAGHRFINEILPRWFLAHLLMQ